MFTFCAIGMGFALTHTSILAARCQRKNVPVPTSVHNNHQHCLMMTQQKMHQSICGRQTDVRKGGEECVLSTPPPTHTSAILYSWGEYLTNRERGAGEWGLLYNPPFKRERG